jgi:hypothetical protein
MSAESSHLFGIAALRSKVQRHRLAHKGEWLEGVHGGVSLMTVVVMAY